MPSNEPGGPPSTPPRPRNERRMSRVHFSEDNIDDEYDRSDDMTASPPSPRYRQERPAIRPLQPHADKVFYSMDESEYPSNPVSGPLSRRASEHDASLDRRVPSRLVIQPIGTDPNAPEGEESKLLARRPYANPSPHIPGQAAFTPSPSTGSVYPASPNKHAVPLKSAMAHPTRNSVDDRRMSKEQSDLPVRPGRAYNPATSPNLPAYTPRRRSGSTSFIEHRQSFDEKYRGSDDEDEKWERERLYASPRRPRDQVSGPRGSFASEYGFPGNYLASLGPVQQLGQPSGPPPLRRRTTLEMEDGLDEDDPDRDAINESSSFHVQGGVFSQLLKLAGSKQKKKKHYAASIASTNTTGSGFFPTMRTLGLKRSDSISSQTFEELDNDDPRVTGVKRKKATRRHSMSELPFIKMLDFGDVKSRDRKRCASIQLHVADILTRQAFILKLAKALMMFGAPSHRIESQLVATALVLEIDAQFVHFPSIVVASFGDPDTRTSETHFIKAVGGDLDLGKLHQVHLIYKSVVHDELDAADGTRQIHQLLHSEREYKLWHRMIMAFLSCGLIAPMGFGGSFIDGLAAGTLGTMLSFMQLHVATRSSMYSNVFEISIATIISFAARGLSVSGYFCYGAVASAGVCLILPGYVILCGALELASKNIVSGSVRMVYAIIYSLFLGFGITIGSDLFYVVDPPARRAAEALFDYATFTTVTGSFTSFPFAETLDDTGMGQLGWNGTFTFSNATTDQILSAYQVGSITCPREPDWPWWRQSMPALYLLGFVPLYSALTALWSFQPLRSVELPVMVFISSAGYFANSLANKFIFDRSDVVSAIGAFVIGVLGNVYSRIFKGTAFTAMVPGVLFLVPSGISAAGGLAMTSANDNHEDSYSQGLIIGFRMVQVAIGITVGLFGSGFLIYSFGRKKNAALFAF